MPAELVIDERHPFPDGISFAHIRIWKVPQPVEGSGHCYKADIPLEAALDTLEGIEGQLLEKAVNVAKFMQNLDVTAKAIKEALKEGEEVPGARFKQGTRGWRFDRGKGGVDPRRHTPSFQGLMTSSPG